MDALIHNGQTYEAVLPVKHCPSNSGCRSVVKQANGNTHFQLTDNFLLTLKVMCLSITIIFRQIIVSIALALKTRFPSKIIDVLVLNVFRNRTIKASGWNTFWSCPPRSTRIR